MFEESSNAAPAEADFTIRPSIFLDYGVDGASGEDALCEVCERGMRFQSRWQFETGAVLCVAFSFGSDGSQRVEAEGVVIECDRTEGREFVTTLAFLEMPQELRSTLGRMRTHLDGGSAGSACGPVPER